MLEVQAVDEVVEDVKTVEVVLEEIKLEEMEKRRLCAADHSSFGPADIVVGLGSFIQDSADSN